MAQYKAVTHEAVKKFSLALPSTWNKGLEERGIYYRTQPTQDFPEQMFITTLTYGEMNPYIIKVPVTLRHLYHPQTKKRLSLARIDELVYPAVNHIIQDLNRRASQVRVPSTERELLAMNELEITQTIAPFTWVSHTDGTASVIYHMGPRFPGVPAQYLRSGHDFDEYVRYILGTTNYLTGVVQVDFDSENGMFAMYGGNGRTIDVYKCAMAFVQHTKNNAKQA